MPSNKTSRDETEYLHFSPGATGLHHLHGHRPALLADRSSGALALDLPPSRPGVFRGGNTKVDSAARSQMFGMLSLLTVAALWGSYSPVLKFLFSQPTPPSAALMTAAQALLAAAFLMAGALGTTSGSREAKGGGGGSAAGTMAHGFRTKAGAPGRGLGSSLRLAVAQMRSILRAGVTAGQGLTGWWRGPRRELLLPARQPQLSGGGADPSGLPGPTVPHRQLEEHPPAESGRMGPEAGGGDYGRGGLRDHPDGDLGTATHPSGGGGSPSKGSDGALTSGRGGGEGPAATPLLVPVQSGGGSGAGGGVGHGAEGGTHLGGGRGRLHSTSHLRSPNLLAIPLGNLAAVGLELGTYNFCGAALGTWGLQRISATKVAFLGQATSLITPLLVALSGQRVALVVWGACCFGVLGATMVAMDGSSRAAAAAAVAAAVAASVGTGSATVGNTTPPLLLVAADLATAAAGGGGAAGHAGVSRAMRLEGTAGPPSLSWARNGLPPAMSQESIGANYVLASCVFYALGTVRLGVHSGRFAPLDLAAASALVYAALSVMWLLAEVIGTPTGGQSDYTVVVTLLRDNTTLALVLWAGVGPGALSSYLQVLGQRIVPAARAQMLYSSAPFWSALIARMLLGVRDGGMGPLAWLGGSVMLSASLIASLLDARPGAGGRAGPAPAVAAAATAVAAHGGGSGAPSTASSTRWSGNEAGGQQREAERDL